MKKTLLMAAALLLLAGRPAVSEIVYGESGLFALGTGSTAVKVGPGEHIPGLTVSPNPFNPSVTIRVDLPGKVKLRIFDAAGRLIWSGAPDRGACVWNGKDGRGRSAVSGVYFVKAISGLHSVTGRMMLIR